MFSAIGAWFGSIKSVASAISAIVGFTKWLGDMLQSRADRASGRAEVEAEQAKEGERVNRKIADEAAKPADEQAAIEALEKGNA